MYINIVLVVEIPVPSDQLPECSPVRAAEIKLQVSWNLWCL